MNKPITMSSLFQRQLAKLANDGKLNLNGKCCCAHTENDDEPWIQIDLKSPMFIRFMRVYLRKNFAKLNRFKNATFGVGKVGMKEGPDSQRICNSFEGTPRESGIVTRACLMQTNRYVFVQLMERNYLTVCEFQVFAK